jgi:hypothetical protein
LDAIAHFASFHSVSNREWEKVRNSDDITWIKKWRDRSDPNSANWHVAQERLAELMHREALPKPWYHQGMGWITIATLIVALVTGIVTTLAWLFPRFPRGIQPNAPMPQSSRVAPTPVPTPVPGASGSAESPE